MRSQVRGRFAPLSDLEIEAYLCGELDGPARAALEAELERSRELQAYLAERRSARREFLERHELRLPAAAQERRRDGSVIWGGLLAAVALLALVVPARPGREAVDVFDAAHDTVRVKGNGLSAELFVKRGETVFRYRAGVALRPQDRVRITVECPAPGYLSVFGRDARGQVSVYYTGLLTSSGRYTVPDSLILDDAEGDEQWVLVHAADLQPVEHYIQAFQQEQPLGAPHTVIQLHKETP